MVWDQTEDWRGLHINLFLALYSSYFWAFFLCGRVSLIFHSRSANKFQDVLQHILSIWGENCLVWCSLGSHYASFMRAKHCPDSRGLLKTSLVLTRNCKHQFSPAGQNIRRTLLSIGRITSVIGCASLTRRICFVHIYVSFTQNY